MEMNAKINALNQQLQEHKLYARLTRIEHLRIFMEYHSFAVFDFMCLLKSLQRFMTLKNPLWTPSSYSGEVTRFINEIVLCEESDIDLYGRPNSHFQMYLQAMGEVGARTKPVLDFIERIDNNTFESAALPKGISEFVEFNLKLALQGSVEEVASAFLFGREKLIPLMFSSIVSILDKSENKYPALMFYLKRHIEVDADEHGPMAQKCLNEICGSDKEKTERALQIAVKSLELRIKLWDSCYESITKASEEAVC